MLLLLFCVFGEGSFVLMLLLLFCVFFWEGSFDVVVVVLCFLGRVVLF